MRVCTSCNKKKSLAEFYKRGDGYRFKCKECVKEYNRSHYKKNRKRYIDNANKHRKRLLEFLRKLKENSPCADCGESYPYWIMQFDHLRDKVFSLANCKNKGIRQIKKEVEKCDIVCANCHADRTYKRLKIHG